MKCPQCGSDMNQHAEKIDYSSFRAQREAADPFQDWTVEEIHACPKCGLSASRRSDSSFLQA